ncbi:hypothetical protein PHAVU_007G210100 [Phaseolus vulgaris]|uniref:Uncharacterized protein n=1 Tax=Phaseolus vulgaris TaxID=3885 RepID=V7BJ97_PHAVU|nr:hypothetical protein PHAVU_007G210100g [Phaseolus vulgaris]ESW17098.1 hypothetical protein PHAVU_007G210100g [Phaseolus vulgaris]
MLVNVKDVNKVEVTVRDRTEQGNRQSMDGVINTMEPRNILTVTMQIKIRLHSFFLVRPKINRSMIIHVSQGMKKVERQVVWLGVSFPLLVESSQNLLNHPLPFTCHPIFNYSQLNVINLCRKNDYYLQ